MDISDHVTSLASFSYSRVWKNWRGHFISVSRRLPVRGGSACISIAPSAALLRNHISSAYKLVYEQNVGLL